MLLLLLLILGWWVVTWLMMADPRIGLQQMNEAVIKLPFNDPRPQERKITNELFRKKNNSFSNVHKPLDNESVITVSKTEKNYTNIEENNKQTQSDKPVIAHGGRGHEPPAPVAEQDLESSNNAELQRMLHEAADENNTVILSINDAGHSDFADNFYNTSIVTHGLHNFLLVNLDVVSMARCKKLPVFCYFDPGLLHIIHGYINDAQGASDFGSDIYFHRTNLKTWLVLQALKLNFTLLLCDLDVILFRNPFSYFTCSDCDIHIQMDRTQYNTGFVYVQPTFASIQLYTTAWQQYQRYHKSHDQAYINMAARILAQSNQTIKIHELSSKLFPCGIYYFEQVGRYFNNKPPCPECVITHNNYIGTVSAKIYRFKENHMWTIDTNGYYSDAHRKYLTYDNPHDFGSETWNEEIQALKNALLLGKLLNRTVILPTFRCCDCNIKKCELPRFRCSLLSSLKIKALDGHFSNAYREHSFLENQQVPSSLLKSISETVFLNTSSPAYRLTNTTSIKNVINVNNSTLLQDITHEMSRLQHYSILKFHSMYGILPTFIDASQNIEWQIHLQNGLVCDTYAQWEVKPWV